MDVSAWLRDLGLERYAPRFRDNEITSEVLPELTDKDLRELGLPLGPRKALLEAIASMQVPASAAGELSDQATAAPGILSRPQAQRRQLTVLFADLVGSKSMSEQLDLKELRAVMPSYHDTCATAVRSLEGYVAQFMGDGVLAYFGWPQAYEDAAGRAVRAGLGLVAAVAGLKSPIGRTLIARVENATGLEVVGDLLGEGAAREETVIGEDPKVAARLQQLAEPGTVVIAESTRRLLEGGFDLKDLGATALRGFAESVRAWQVAGESHARDRFEARQTAGLTPLVGRAHEVTGGVRAARRIGLSTGRNDP